MDKLISDNAKNTITCVILAGGRGSRMGGRDKGLVEFRHRPLIEHIIEKISAQTGSIVISANRNLDVYKKYGFPVISDLQKNYQGPLAGIAAAMHAAKTPLLMSVPCDSPLLPDNLSERLHATLTREDADLAVADTGKLQPVFCLVKTNLFNNLSAFLDSGERKIDLWYNEIKTARADFTDRPECFTNINSADDMQALKKNPKILGFCAYSGTGKTTLLKQIIPLLKKKGLKIGVIKHAHHSFDTDQPGKDSYELRKAGAKQMLVSSSRRQVLITERSEKDPEPGLSDLIKALDPEELDLILVEGFKSEPFPKIELHRPSLEKPLIYASDNNVIAFATDGTPPDDVPVPVLDLNDISGIADFIVASRV